MIQNPDHFNRQSINNALDSAAYRCGEIDVPRHNSGHLKIASHLDKFDRESIFVENLPVLGVIKGKQHDVSYRKRDSRLILGQTFVREGDQNNSNREGGYFTARHVDMPLSIRLLLDELLESPLMHRFDDRLESLPRRREGVLYFRRGFFVKRLFKHTPFFNHSSILFGKY